MIRSVEGSNVWEVLPCRRTELRTVSSDRSSVSSLAASAAPDRQLHSAGNHAGLQVAHSSHETFVMFPS